MTDQNDMEWCPEGGLYIHYKPKPKDIGLVWFEMFDYLFQKSDGSYDLEDIQRHQKQAEEEKTVWEDYVQKLYETVTSFLKK